MEKRHILFGVIVLLFVGVVYFIGPAVTSFVTQTMYCDWKSCHEICTYTHSCQDINEICCEKEGFGICESPSNCEKEHDPIGLEGNVVKESPQKPFNVLVYVVPLVFLVFVILYYRGKKKS